MKNLKKALSVILTIAMLMGMSVNVFAEGIAPRLKLINSASCAITDLNNDTATIRATASGTSLITQIDVSVEVQVKGLFGYSTDQTLSDTFYKSSGTFIDTIDIDSSKTYRLYVTYTAYSPSGSETVNKTSTTT